MPKQKNTFLRVLVPALILLGGVGFAVAFFLNNSGQGTPPATAPVPATSAPPNAPAPAAAAGAPGMQAPGASVPPVVPGQPAPPPPEPSPGALSLAGLRAATFEGDAATKGFDSIGTIDPAAPIPLRVEFTPLGAGVRSVTLAEHFDTIRLTEHTVVQQMQWYTPPAGADGTLYPPVVVAPMSLLSVQINGTDVDLTGGYEQEDGSLFGRAIWRQTAPGSFEAVILNDQQQPVARVHRRYVLAEGSYDIRVHQGLQNLSGQPMTVRWQQFGPIDLQQDNASYGGDKRRVRFGYLLKPNLQGADPTVTSSDFLMDRGGVLGKRGKTTGSLDAIRPLWPNEKSVDQGYRLVWTGMTNRYFGAALHELFDPANPAADKMFQAAAAVDRIVLDRYIVRGSEYVPDPVVVLRTTSDVVPVGPSGAAEFPMGYFAGPLAGKEIKRDPLAAAAGMQGLVVYNFGGPCGFCTFGWLTSALLGLLHLLHSGVFDWGVAIILLVLIVRSILHPVTRWSQIRMQRFGAQMQGMAPKQKKLQEKYGQDPQKLRAEMAKLWREEGISPTGALGCIPMFLQTPVWIALYATLFFAIELRHQPAFYGVFQAIIPGYPHFMGYFLGDLAEPDRFWYFGRTIITLPLLGPIDSFNLLPILLGVVFFIQQKYLTPPATTPLTPEQEQQQKIMKVMMVVMFPLFMYNAPSGLALYFIANSTLGILESRWIRAHINKNDLLKPTKKGPPKPGSFMDRLQKLAEERQKQMMGRGQQPPRKRV